MRDKSINSGSNVDMHSRGILMNSPRHVEILKKVRPGGGSTVHVSITQARIQVAKRYITFAMRMLPFEDKKIPNVCRDSTQYFRHRADIHTAHGQECGELL